MAYWGMAMANVNNKKRAADFMKHAQQLKKKASPREVMWIEAYDNYFGEKGKDSERGKDLVLALEKIIQKYPAELEAKAFLVFQIWENESRDVPLTSRQAVDALAREVLAKEPLHPVHHARIHLWNYKEDKQALNSAALCGQSAPAIAHMWHMPGHTYSALKRYADAAWQQEASARVDHAYMMAARILPDQIFNFAHNNQWLCTDLLYCGRVHEAISLAKNMVELPRHPKYNTLSRPEENSDYARNNGSSMLGRKLADTMYLEPTELPEEQAHRLYALALAHFALGRAKEATKEMASLEGCWKELRNERFEAAEKAEQKAKKDKKETAEPMVNAMKSFNSRLEHVEKYRDELKIWSLLAEGKSDEARDALTAATELPKAQRARLWQAMGDKTNSVKLATELVGSSTNQAPELALAASLYWESGDKKAATKTFKRLRGVSSRFELDTPIFARLSPIARELKLPED